MAEDVIDRAKEFISNSEEKRTFLPIINSESLHKIESQIWEIFSTYDLSLDEISFICFRLGESLKEIKTKNAQDDLLKNLPMSGILSKVMGVCGGKND